ncbi:MAG: uracil-DNA glycosylase [Elusimicrobia bacterium]|nr:uracil-DNA glycosylase [Elusimicrobiota bacterium]
MNQSEFGKIIKLAKTAIEEELWGNKEILMEKKAVSIQNSCSKEEKNKGDSSDVLDAYKSEISACKKCHLGKTRIKFVFGEGNPNSKLMFIGEGPGFDEDHLGRPFVGRAGQLLTKIIESMGLKREDVYIANIVKCHPMKDPSDSEKRGNDRAPTPEEIAECLPYLQKQIEIISPKIICALGSHASKTLLSTEETIGVLRGKFRYYNGTLLMPTYHPAALLRNPSLKKDVWEDMKLIMAELKKV